MAAKAEATAKRKETDKAVEDARKAKSKVKDLEDEIENTERQLNKQIDKLTAEKKQIAADLKVDEIAYEAFSRSAEEGLKFYLKNLDAVSVEIWDDKVEGDPSSRVVVL